MASSQPLESTIASKTSDSAGPVGLCVMLSKPTPVAEGPMGSGETLSSPDPAGILSQAMPAGMLLPVGSVGPVGPYGMLSPSDSESAILVDPGGGGGVAPICICVGRSCVADADAVLIYR